MVELKILKDVDDQLNPGCHFVCTLYIPGVADKLCCSLIFIIYTIHINFSYLKLSLALPHLEDTTSIETTKDPSIKMDNSSE